MKTTSSITALLLGAFIITALCADFGKPPGPRNEAAGPETEGFRLTISTTNRVVETGQPLLITMTLHNLLTNAAPLRLGNQYFRWQVLGPTGRPVPTTPYGAQMLDPTAYKTFGISVPPTGSFTGSFCLNLHYEMTNTGLYTIKLSQSVPKRTNYSEQVWVSSGPLKLTLVTPHPKPSSPNQHP